MTKQDTKLKEGSLSATSLFLVRVLSDLKWSILDLKQAPMPDSGPFNPEMHPLI